MKRNIFLGFLLIGLVVMEWGCCKGRAFFYSLSSISAFVAATDTIMDKYSNVGFYLDVHYDEVTAVSQSSSALIACDNDHIYNSTPQSMEVSTNKPYRGTEDYKTFVFVNDMSLEEWIASGQLSFVDAVSLGKPPLQTDTFAFTFTVFDTEGNIFKTTTEPIIITP